jgi:hypothetical protein
MQKVQQIYAKREKTHTSKSNKEPSDVFVVIIVRQTHAIKVFMRQAQVNRFSNVEFMVLKCYLSFISLNNNFLIVMVYQGLRLYCKQWRNYEIITGSLRSSEPTFLVVTLFR